MHASKSTAGETLKAMGIAFAFAVFGVIGIVAVTFKANFAENEVAFVFPSDFDRHQTFTSIIHLGGIPVSFGMSDNIIIAKFDENSAEEAFDLSEAIFALNPKTPGICVPII